MGIFLNFFQGQGVCIIQPITLGQVEHHPSVFSPVNGGVIGAITQLCYEDSMS